MLYIVIFVIFIVILYKISNDTFNKIAKEKKREKNNYGLLVSDKDNSRISDFLEVNYSDNKSMDDIELKTAIIDKNLVVPYVSKFPNRVGIINELQFNEVSKNDKKDVTFIAAPQKHVLYCLLQYYQSDDYINKREALLEQNIDLQIGLEGFENKDYAKEKTTIQEKLDRLVRLGIKDLRDYIFVDQKTRTDNNDNTPFIIAVDGPSSMSFNLFKRVAKEYKWNIREYTSKGFTESPKDYNEKIVYYKFMDFDDARSEFVKSNSLIDCLFYLCDDRDWKVKDLFVKYFTINKRIPIILEFKKTKTKNSGLLKTFIHIIDTSLYYTNNSVGGDEGGEDESMAIRLPTLAVRNILICNKDTDIDIVLLLTAICIQNYTILQQYIYPGCAEGESQTSKVVEINKLEKNISELSIKFIKNMEDKHTKYANGIELEKTIGKLNSLQKEYIKIGKKCQFRIPVNPFPNLDEIGFSFPDLPVHPVSKEYYHENGIYSRNPRFKYDLTYYSNMVQELYWEYDLIHLKLKVEHLGSLL